MSLLRDPSFDTQYDSWEAYRPWRPLNLPEWVVWRQEPSSLARSGTHVGKLVTRQSGGSVAQDFSIPQGTSQSVCVMAWVRSPHWIAHTTLAIWRLSEYTPKVVALTEFNAPTEWTLVTLAGTRFKYGYEQGIYRIEFYQYTVGFDSELWIDSVMAF